MPARAKWGKLFLDFRWKGIRCREFTGLRDDKTNRARTQELMNLIDAEIALGTFDYRRHFPDGPRLADFYPEAAMKAVPMTVSAYIKEWHARRSPLLPDGSVAEGALLHPSTWLHDGSVIRRHLEPALGSFRLDDLKPRHVREFRKTLQDKQLHGKTIANVIGLLHRALEEAVEDEIIDVNPVTRITSWRSRRAAAMRENCDPLTADEVVIFLAKVPAWFRDLYTVWFRTGWRSSEIVAVRYEWLDFEREEVALRKGRNPRGGGLEATPKTGPRIVDCSYDPAIFAALRRLQKRSLELGQRDYVFTDSAGKPLSQEWLHKKVWRPTLRVAGLRERGQYSIRDTFISLALSAGEDPGWVAKVCGTSEQMIFQSYRKWMPSQRRTDGQSVARVLGGAQNGHQMGTKKNIRARKPGKLGGLGWTRSQRIRTVARIPVEFSLLETRAPFTYQQIASEAHRLKLLGLPATIIARSLRVTDKTVAKAIRYRANE